MHHIFVTYSLVEEHLSCFQFLANMNKAAMNIVEHMSLRYAVLWIYAQEWHSWVLRSEKWRNHQLNFQKSLYKFALPAAMKEWSPCSTLSPVCAITWVFDLSHSEWCKVEHQSYVDMDFPGDQSCWTFLFSFLFFSWIFSLFTFQIFSLSSYPL